ncbi:MAG TPA: helix-turn-helix transcriptional regulator [Candidatus Limnocylindria bacterium]
MPSGERLRTIGQRQGERLIREAGAQVRELRYAAGLSQAELARTMGVSRTFLSRLELGRLRHLDIGVIAVAIALLGHRLTCKAWPVGEPLRDSAHLRLLARFEARLAPTWRVRREAVMPVRGDLRAWDLRLDGPSSIGVEAETHLHDLQAVERALAAKRQDSRVDHVILLLADTHHNRAVLCTHRTSLRGEFPLTTRELLAALGAGADPRGSGIAVM